MAPGHRNLEQEVHCVSAPLTLSPCSEKPVPCLGLCLLSPCGLGGGWRLGSLLPLCHLGLGRWLSQLCGLCRAQQASWLFPAGKAEGHRKVGALSLCSEGDRESRRGLSLGKRGQSASQMLQVKSWLILRGNSRHKTQWSLKIVRLHTHTHTHTTTTTTTTMSFLWLQKN